MNFLKEQWRKVRGCYLRYTKKLTEYVNGSNDKCNAVPPHKRFIYYDQMHFLNNTPSIDDGSFIDDGNSIMTEDDGNNDDENYYYYCRDVNGDGVVVVGGNEISLNGNECNDETNDVDNSNNNKKNDDDNAEEEEDDDEDNDEHDIHRLLEFNNNSSVVNEKSIICNDKLNSSFNVMTDLCILNNSLDIEKRIHLQNSLIKFINTFRDELSQNNKCNELK